MDGWDWNGNQTFFSDWKYQNTILQGKTLQFMPHICHHGRCLCKKIEHEKMHMDFNLFWQIFGFQISISISRLEISGNILTNFWISNLSARFWICRGEPKNLERDCLPALWPGKSFRPSVAGQDSHCCVIEIAESGLQYACSSTIYSTVKVWGIDLKYYDLQNVLPYYCCNISFFVEMSKWVCAALTCTTPSWPAMKNALTASLLVFCLKHFSFKTSA